MNIGIVGCGRITTLRHLPALRGLDGARVVAVADVDGGRLERVADEYGVGLRFGTYEELIADPLVEAVAVCVPAALHADITVMALEAGKHVLVEKPLTLRVEEAERVREAAAGAPGILTIGLNLRHHRLVRRAAELVREGVLGELQAIRTVFTSSFDYRDTAPPWRLRRDTGGGAVGEMAPHHLDLWRFVTGREVEEVFASSSSGMDEDETAIVSGVLAGGVRADTLVSQRSTNVNEVEVFGERGRLRVACYRYDGLELQLGRGFGGDLRHRLRGVARAVTELPAFARGVRGASDYIDSYRAQWRRFGEAAAGRGKPDPGIEEGVRNVEVLSGALESLASGQVVPVARVGAAR